MNGLTIWSRAPGGWQVRDTGRVMFYLPGDGPFDALVFPEDGDWWRWQVIAPDGDVRAEEANYGSAEDAAVAACEWIEDKERFANVTEADWKGY